MRSILITILILLTMTIAGCKENSRTVHMLPVTGLKSYYIEYKDDSIKIYEERYEKPHRKQIYKFYLKDGNYYTKDFGFEEQEARGKKQEIRLEVSRLEVREMI